MVTIAVLSYNRPQLLEGALRSIAAQTYAARDVVVIDNPSPASPRIRELVAAFAGVRLIANTTNNGFTGGMNQGLAEAKGEFVYFTEDDIELEPDCLSTLIEYLSGQPDVALAGPVMWNRSTPTIRCAGGSFELGPVYRMRVTGAGDRQLLETSPFRTMFLPGASILARTAELRALGGFHPDFFMYGEDVELCARVKKRGRAISIVPAARAHHHEPPEAPESSALAFHKQKNLVALYLLHARPGVLPAFFIRYLLLEGVKKLRGDWRTLPVWGRAWVFAMMRSPKFLAQRWKNA